MGLVHRDGRERRRPEYGSVSDGRLRYGAVRVGPDGLSMGIESLGHVGACRRLLFEQAVAACQVDPDSVLQVRLSESSVAVQVVDFDDLTLPIRIVCRPIMARTCQFGRSRSVSKERRRSGGTFGASVSGA
jgi:hypothetical protein